MTSRNCVKKSVLKYHHVSHILFSRVGASWQIALPSQVRSMLLTPSRKPAPRIGDSRQPQKTRLRKEPVSDDQRLGSLCTLFHDLQRVTAMKENGRHDGDIERAQPIG